MITFSKFGSHGNLGNQLHQLATLIGFSEKYGCELVCSNGNMPDIFSILRYELQKLNCLFEEPIIITHLNSGMYTNMILKQRM